MQQHHEPAGQRPVLGVRQRLDGSIDETGDVAAVAIIASCCWGCLWPATAHSMTATKVPGAFAVQVTCAKRLHS